MQTDPRPTGPVDTRSMNCAHMPLRREFRMAAGVVRGVDTGDVRRARVVTNHLEFLCTGLNHHHAVEDRLLWPKLLQRVPEELAPIVELMQAQHARLHDLLEAIDGVRPRWSALAAAAERDELAHLFDELYVALSEHLDAEEQRMLPIVARSISHAEWQDLNEQARDGLPKRDLPLVFGLLQYDGDPEVVAEILGEAPLLLRLLVPPLARRAFRRRALAVHGTATP